MFLHSYLCNLCMYECNVYIGTTCIRTYVHMFVHDKSPLPKFSRELPPCGILQSLGAAGLKSRGGGVRNTYTQETVCVYMHTHTYIYMHICIYVHTYVFAEMYICLYIYVTCMHIYVYMCFYTCTHTYTHTHDIYTYTYLHLCRCTYMHTCMQHIHTYVYIYAQ